MKTKIIKINSKKIELAKIKEVAEVLKNGNLVAFPTETVYGLGANALNPKAVKKIFKTKGRPTDNPLIVHIADKTEVYKLAKEVPKEAKKLMNRFWPGPLTLVLKKSEIVPKEVTAGLDSVAIRMPSNKIALSLIKYAGVPIAAPSANLAGKPSPTSAEHVLLDLNGRISIIIDGGETKIGLESTVVDLTTKPPLLLRPGAVSFEELRKVLQNIKIYSVKGKKETKKTKSPGMKYKHYAPKAKVILVCGNLKRIRTQIQKEIKKYKREGKKIGVIVSDKHNYGVGIIKYNGKNNITIAKNLFKIFRDFDRKKVDVIIVGGVSEKGIGLAIMNRLKKAASKIVKV